MSTVNVPNLLLWLEDLETTTDPQGKGWLTTPRGDCCLGRACKVAINSGVDVDVEFCSDGLNRYTAYDGSTTNLPSVVAGWLGLENSPYITLNGRDGAEMSGEIDEKNEVALDALNDDYDWSFRRIAAAIRGHYAHELATHQAATV